MSLAEGESDHLVISDDLQHPANLICELCRKFYPLGWVCALVSSKFPLLTQSGGDWHWRRHEHTERVSCASVIDGHIVLINVQSTATMSS